MTGSGAYKNVLGIIVVGNYHRLRLLSFTGSGTVGYIYVQKG